MKKKLTLDRRTIKNLKLKLMASGDRKVAPLDAAASDPSNGSSC